jgi:hypothetical protein
MTRSSFFTAAMLTTALACGGFGLTHGGEPAKARVSGVVVDQTGAPVPGAEVHDGGFWLDATVADQEGKFSLTLRHTRYPGVGYKDLVAVSLDGNRQGLWNIASVFEATAQGKIELRPTREIRVRVTDGKGMPVPDAEVALKYEEGNWVFIKGKTDAAGEASLRVMVGQKVEWLVAAKHGAGLDYVKGNILAPDGLFLAGEKPVEVKLELNGAQKLVLEAKDQQGRFVSGVQFVPWYLMKKDKLRNNSSPSVVFSGIYEALPSLVCQTNEDGEAVLDWVPKNLQGQMPFLCRSDDWSVASQPSYNAITPEPIVSVTLLGNVRLAGRVLLPDGRPAADIIVLAEGHGADSQSSRALAQTAEDGTFEIVLPPEKQYLISVSSKEWTADHVISQFVGEGDQLADVTLRLQRGTRLHGKVEGNDSNQARRHFVIVTQTQGKGQLSYWPEVDAAGRYEIRLGAGSYQVNTSGGQPQTVEIAGETDVELNLREIQRQE